MRQEINEVKKKRDVELEIRQNIEIIKQIQAAENSGRKKEPAKLVPAPRVTRMPRSRAEWCERSEWPRLAPRTEPASVVKDAIGVAS